MMTSDGKGDLRVYPIKVVLERKMVVGDDRSYRGWESRYDRICGASSAPCEVWGALG